MENEHENCNRIIDALRKENDALREALEFYANKDNWMYVDVNGSYTSKLGVTLHRIGANIETENGKRSRQVLEKYPSKEE